MKFTKYGIIYVVLKDLDLFSLPIEIIDKGSGIKKQKYNYEIF